MGSLKKNYIYNTAYQLLSLVIPLITIPYVSRALGADGVGIYSYTYSIVSYFVLVAMLGISNYGNRAIAKVRDDKDKLRETFWGIYAIQVMMTLVVLIGYLAYIFVMVSDYKNIVAIQSLYIIATLFDVTWLFFGLEEFRVTVFRNALVKLLSLAMILCFVRGPGDVWIYTLILAGGTLAGQIILLPKMLKEVGAVVWPRVRVLKRHLLPMLVLFIPVIAVSLYRVMDKIMLGMMSPIEEVGYYEQADKIIGVPISLVTALGTVMLPRISNLVAKGDKETISRYIEKSVAFIMFMAFPVCFGLIAVADDFIPIFLGPDFNKTIVLVQLMAITITFVSFANIIRTHYLIPHEKDRVYVGSVVSGAIVNLVANCLLIPKLQSIGACIGTLLAELIVMMYLAISVRNELKIRQYLIKMAPFLMKSLVMFIIVLIVGEIDVSNGMKIVLQVMTGVMVYGTLNRKYIMKTINVSSGKIKLRGR